MDAFLYLQVRPGAVEDVVVQLENARGVRAAVAVIGDWDVLAALHAQTLNGIAEAVARDVHQIDGVLRTVTAPVVPGDVLGLAGGGLRRPVPLQHRGEACFVHVRAAPGAAAHLPLTHRDHSSAVVFVTGHQCAANTSAIDWAALAKLRATLCFYMGVRRLPEITRNLLGHGMPADMPLAVISEATLPAQKILTGTLRDGEKLSAGLAGQPALVVIGEVVRLSSFAAELPQLHAQAMSL